MISHKLLPYGVDFDIYTQIISHGKQNGTLTFKRKCQGHTSVGFRIKICMNRAPHSRRLPQPGTLF